MLLILFLIFISVDSERDACLKRNSASMTCVSSSNSTSLGRECDINVAVGSDQVNTFLNLKNSIDYIQTKAGSDFVQFLRLFRLLNLLKVLGSRPIWIRNNAKFESIVWVSLYETINMYHATLPKQLHEVMVTQN